MSGKEVVSISVEFKVRQDCGSEGPERIVPLLDGSIIGRDQDGEDVGKIGVIQAHLVCVGRCLDENESLYSAMDSVDDELLAAYATLFPPEDEGDEYWSRGVLDIYGIDVAPGDLLYIRKVKVEDPHRGKGFGAQALRETMATFAHGPGGLVALTSFPLQWSGYTAPDHPLRQQTDWEAKRKADFAKLAAYWQKLGFRNVADSDVYVFNPALKDQPAVPHGAARSRRRRR